MAETYRTINTRFWSDNWIRKLNALDRYLFLYLLTNQHVNWCGIYELDIGMMAFESGIDKEDLQNTMLPRLIPKIIYDVGWVFIYNFSHYHSGGINAEKGRLAAIETLPERIRAKIKVISKSKWGRSNPLEGGSSSASASASALPCAQERTEVEISLPEKEKITIVSEEEYENNRQQRVRKPPSRAPEVFHLFRNYDRAWLVKPPQRGAAERLLEKRGLDGIKSALRFYEENKENKFCPQITSPYELESKWTKLFLFKKRQEL